MSDAETILMTVRLQGIHPSIKEAAEELSVAEDAIDPDFGVVSLDPARGEFAVQVHRDQLPNDEGAGARFRGPFSNPPVEAFGPVRSR